jgi:hypothetical protein|tara:strand:- start:139 stop:507 length:369 start_codon:yes stop_codon:yes gene_type:complete
MAEINIQKTVFNRTEFERVVDRNFKTFVPPVELVDTDTVAELFRLYNKLYLEIPLRNSNSSHEYLIRRSSELVDLDETDDQLQPLLDEIANLRAQLVDANEDVLRLELEKANSFQSTNNTTG